MESILEQLLAMDQTLKSWLGENGRFFVEAAKQDRGHIPPYAQGASPEVVAAGALHSIEIAAKYLRERLGVTLITGASVKIISGGLHIPTPLPDACAGA